MNILKKILLVTSLSLLSLSSAHAGYQTYADAAAFKANVGASKTDGFDNYNGVTSVDNAQALSSANIRYVSTGFNNWVIFSGSVLCWGCNGSGYMDLSASTMGTAGGVYGFMTNYAYNYGGDKAYVTFANGSTADIALATSGMLALTSSDLIAKVEFSDARGHASYNTIGFHDVTVADAAANVPEPASLALLGLGLAGVLAARRRK